MQFDTIDPQEIKYTGSNGESPDFIWVKTGNTYTKVPNSIEICGKTVPAGIYNVRLLPDGGMCLEEFKSRFEWTEKFYNIGSLEEFQKTFETVYNSLTSNIGLLLNGFKGTGKTQFAERLSNYFIDNYKLPVILFDSPEQLKFLKIINFNCIAFFDEFEKNFQKETDSILSYMSGVYAKKELKNIFLFTTNYLTIDDNLLGRLSRIRYILNFGNLEPEIVSQVMTDLLEDQKYRDDVFRIINSLELSTIDTLKCIIQEFNILGDKASENIEKYFNLNFKQVENNFIYIRDPKYDFEYFCSRCELYGTPKSAADRNKKVNPEHLSDEELCFETCEEPFSDSCYSYYELDLGPVYKSSFWMKQHYSTFVVGTRVDLKFGDGDYIIIEQKGNNFKLQNVLNREKFMYLHATPKPNDDTQIQGLYA